MTKDQEQLITGLFIKFGGMQGVIDIWLHHDTELALDEQAAVVTWLNSETGRNQWGVTEMVLRDDSGFRCVTAEISLDDVIVTAITRE